MKIPLLLLILVVAHSQKFYYRRALECIKKDATKCSKWNESTVLTYVTYYSVYCLSENNYVLTRNGPKSMKELAIGDELWGYDMKTGQKRYSKLVAWLHRNTKGIIKYDSIKTQQGLEFEASDYHNVGFVDKQGKIDFKFAKDLEEGDELVGFPENDPHVQLLKTQIEKRGLYTPFTETGNYYIFDSAYQGSKPVPASQSMILVHSLSHVRHPSSQLWKAENFIQICDILGLNTQPSDDELYMHPLYSHFNFLFGSSWQQAVQQAKHLVNEHMQTVSSSSGSFSSSFSSSSSCASYTSSYSCEQERQDRMKALGLSVSIIQEVPLF